jgi:ABC-2 type transport system ATP-binding protein
MIQINNLTKDFGNRKGVFHITFNIKEKEVFGFLGPNGAGKTTTIRHLMGFLNADAGECTINGMECRHQTAAIMKQVGYLPGELALLDAMTGMQFFQFMAKLRQQTNLSLCRQLIERFELDSSTSIKKMSKGMKQKVAVITAFMHDPQILILDEPTSGLDPLMQIEFAKLISEEKNKGKTILMSSHNFDEVEKNCDTIGIIRAGEMVCIEDIHSIRQKKRQNYTLEFSDTEEASKFVNNTHFAFGQLTDASVEVKEINNLNNLIKELSKYNIIDIQSEKYSLEHLFMHYYGGNKS